MKAILTVSCLQPKKEMKMKFEFILHDRACSDYQKRHWNQYGNGGLN
jgi:hypothetical protein